MDYVRVYGTVLTHPKWQALSPRARVALVQSWMYAGLHETDGYVPEVAWRLVDLAAPVAGELERVGWIHRNGDGWVLHDWADHQTDIADVRARREERRRVDRERQRRHRGKEDQP